MNVLYDDDDDISVRELILLFFSLIRINLIDVAAAGPTVYSYIPAERGKRIDTI